MDRAKIETLLLLLVSLFAILFVLNLAFSIPILMRMGVQPNVPDQFGGTGCFIALTLIFLLPPASIPGLLGVLHWRRRVRAQQTNRKRESDAQPGREAALQSCFNTLVSAWVEGGGESSIRDCQRRVEALDAARRRRMDRFFAECAAHGWAFVGPDLGPVSAEGRLIVQETTIRRMVIGFFLVALFSLLGLLPQPPAYLGTELPDLFKVERGADAAWLGSSGCLLFAITSGAGGFGLVWLLRKERRWWASQTGTREQVRGILLRFCKERLDGLMKSGLLEAPREAVIQKLARASLLDAFSELDPARKADLLLHLRDRAILAPVDLHGADLRGVDLSAADLSGVCLAGIDFSDSVFFRARLERSDLKGCRLSSSDLREASAGESDFWQCDFQGARLHRCDLRGANLRNTDLRGANLWQVELAAADLTDSFVGADQLMAVASLEGARLPFELPRPAGMRLETRL